MQKMVEELDQDLELDDDKEAEGDEDKDNKAEEKKEGGLTKVGLKSNIEKAGSATPQDD